MDVTGSKLESDRVEKCGVHLCFTRLKNHRIKKEKKCIYFFTAVLIFHLSANVKCHVKCNVLDV